jgi:hypothetical protein
MPAVSSGHVAVRLDFGPEWFSDGVTSPARGGYQSGVSPMAEARRLVADVAGAANAVQLPLWLDGRPPWARPARRAPPVKPSVLARSDEFQHSSGVLPEADPRGVYV